MSIKVGSILLGRVENITEFGAFIKLPIGTSGLLHISEVSKDYVKNIKDYLKKDQEVKVKVISIDESKNKIGLTMINVEGEAEVIDTVPNTRTSFSNKTNGRKESTQKKPSFESMLEKFLKDSHETQRQLRKNTEKKQNGGKRVPVKKPSNNNKDED